MAWLVFLLLLITGFSFRFLRGENLAYLDSNLIPQPVGEPSEEHHAVVASLADFSASKSGQSQRQKLQAIRGFLDSMSDGKDFTSSFHSVDSGGLRGEWVVAPGVNPRRRILYIHGGAWLAGSAYSHRSVTDRMSQLADAAVFALDYRLMPENSRRDGIVDCQEAYRWLLTNGPQGAEELDFLAVAGDSAGGNLTLSVLAWARDEGLRQADAGIAFSPATDATLSSPSLDINVASDPMLGPQFGKLTKIPRILLWWGSWFTSRIRPSDPLVSPLRGDLSGLPPILIQVSEAEMLFDDARRYVTKAQAAGSPVELQSWPFMVHVWQMFTPQLPEADEAYANIAEFLASVAGHQEAKSEA